MSGIDTPTAAHSDACVGVRAKLIVSSTSESVCADTEIRAALQCQR